MIYHIPAGTHYWRTRERRFERIRAVDWEEAITDKAVTYSEPEVIEERSVEDPPYYTFALPHYSPYGFITLKSTGVEVFGDELEYDLARHKAELVTLYEKHALGWDSFLPTTQKNP